MLSVQRQRDRESDRKRERERERERHNGNQTLFTTYILVVTFVLP